MTWLGAAVAGATPLDRTFGLIPGAYARFRELYAGLWDGRTLDPGVIELCRRRIATLLGCPDGDGLPGGPMLDGWHEGELVGSGTVIWRSRRLLGAGKIDEAEFLRRAADSAPSPGHCNTMGTASTMNSAG